MLIWQRGLTIPTNEGFHGKKSTINGGLSIDMFDYRRVTNDHGDLGDMGLEFSNSRREVATY